MTKLYQDPFGPPWKFSWIKLLLTWDGGILQMFWVEWIAATLGCTLILLLVYFKTRDNEDLYELSPAVEKIRDSVLFVARRFQAAVALMLGFYSIQCIGRWNGVQAQHGAVMNTINAVAMRIAWDLQSEDDDDHGGFGQVKDDSCRKTNEYRDQFSQQSSNDATSEEEEPKKQEEEKKDDLNSQKEPTAKEEQPSITKDNDKSTHATNDKEEEGKISIDVMRIRLMRWLSLSHAIVVGNIYETRDNAFSSLEKIRESGLATETEYHYLAQKRRDSGFYHIVPLYWFVELLKDAKRKNLFGVTDGLIGAMMGQMQAIGNGLTELHRIRNAPLPLSYRQITNLTVRFYLFILMVAAALTDIDSEDNRGRLVPQSFWIVFIFSWEYLLFVGWLTVADALSNPFRCWADEIEWINYVKAINHSSLFMAHGFHCKTKTVDDLKGRAPVLSATMREWHDVCYVRADDTKPNEPPPESGWGRFAFKATGFSP